MRKREKLTPEQRARQNERQREYRRLRGAKRVVNPKILAQRSFVIFHEQNGICGICNEPMTLGKHDIDHIKPLVRGQEDESRENLRATHHRCNLLRGHLTDEEVGIQLEMNRFYAGTAHAEIGKLVTVCISPEIRQSLDDTCPPLAQGFHIRRKMYESLSDPVTIPQRSGRVPDTKVSFRMSEEEAMFWRNRLGRKNIGKYFRAVFERWLTPSDTT